MSPWDVFYYTDAPGQRGLRTLTLVLALGGVAVMLVLWLVLRPKIDEGRKGQKKV